MKTKPENAMSSVKLSNSDAIALSIAIVSKAASDYKKTCLTLKTNPKHKGAKLRKKELDSFFGSEWYTHLTDVDGNIIKTRIERETGYAC